VSTIDEGGPAYPVPGGPYREELSNGMTVRQVYAGQAMHGMLSCQDFMNDLCKAIGSKDQARREVSRHAYAQADAMIAEGKEPIGWTSRELKMLQALKRIMKGYKDPKTMDGATSFEIADQAVDEAEEAMR